MAPVAAERYDACLTAKPTGRHVTRPGAAAAGVVPLVVDPASGTSFQFGYPPRCR